MRGVNQDAATAVKSRAPLDRALLVGVIGLVAFGAARLTMADLRPRRPAVGAVAAPLDAAPVGAIAARPMGKIRLRAPYGLRSER